MISHLMSVHLDNKNIQTLNTMIAVVKITNDIHQDAVLLFLTVKNLFAPDPPNDEYLPRNRDLNQWIET